MHTIAKATAKSKIPPADRNRALLLKALAAGCHAIPDPLSSLLLVNSKDDPFTLYEVTLSSKGMPGSERLAEACNCPAMDGTSTGAGYHKEVIRWRDRAGQWQTNGVLPCSHILIARFHRQWDGAGHAIKDVILDAIPGLAAALAAGDGYYDPF